MKYEYLLLNLIIAAGPLVMSFEKRLQFVRRWRHAFTAILAVAVPFIIWDALVTGRHWWFNEQYTLAVRLVGLPLEEWLFFLTVPFAALFVWEVLSHYLPDNSSIALQRLGQVLCLAPIAGLWLFASGREYTGLMLVALGAAAILDAWLRTRLFAQQRLMVYLGLLTVFMLIFNGYLTARPVVLYDEQYQLGMRVGTIPVEDFGYGFALLLLVTIVYLRLRRGRYV